MVESARLVVAQVSDRIRCRAFDGAAPLHSSVKIYRSTYPRRVIGDHQVFVAAILEETPSPLRGGELRRLWFWNVTIAEFFGFAVPAVIGASTRDSPAWISLPALLIAGS